MSWLYYYHISFIYEDGSTASPDLLFLYLPRIGEIFTTYKNIKCEIIKEIIDPELQFKRTLVLRKVKNND
jgi:hypothetical protein